MTTYLGMLPCAVDLEAVSTVADKAKILGWSLRGFYELKDFS